MRGHRDLEIVVAGSLMGVAALAIPWAPLCLLFAAPLTLLAPGYAIAAATFARKRIDRPRLLLLGLALSLVVLALGPLPLNYLPDGIKAAAWTILLLLVVLNGCRVAALRRPPAGPRQPLPRIRVGRRNGGLLAGGALLTAIALALAVTTLPAKNARGFTALWLTPNAVAGTGAEIGVGSEEQHETGYVLRVRLGDSAPSLVRKFRLKPGESRTVQLGALGRRTVPLTALLYRQDRPDRVYRRVSGWLAGEPG